jgi:hypothetical protein
MGFPLYDTVLSVVLSSASNQEMSLAAGMKTFVHLTSPIQTNVIGISVVGGNVDGMVIVCLNENVSNSIIFLAESGLEGTLANRIRNAQGDFTNGAGHATWHRYSTFDSRWHQIGRV